MQKMIKVTITESQLQYILNETSYPLNSSDKNGIPDNAYGTDIFVNNVDKDAENDVTITDNPSHKRAMSNRLFARSRNVCESNFDDNRTSNFGKNEKEHLISVASNNGGKMSKNIANELNNGGSRNNTNNVRKSRLEKQKHEDPITFYKNGGNETLKALNSSTAKESNKNNINNPKKVIKNNITNNSNTNKNHHTNDEMNIYYY